MNSTNRIFIGLAAVVLIAVTGLLLPSDQDFSFFADGEMSFTASGESSTSNPIDTESCSAECEDGASCTESKVASCHASASESTGASGSCSASAETRRCGGFGARDGSGKGSCQN